MHTLAGTGRAVLLDLPVIASPVAETVTRGGLMFAFTVTVLALALLVGVVSVARRALALVSHLLNASATLARLVAVVMISLVVFNGLLLVVMEVAKQRSS